MTRQQIREHMPHVLENTRRYCTVPEGLLDYGAGGDGARSPRLDTLESTFLGALSLREKPEGRMFASLGALPGLGP